LADKSTTKAECRGENGRAGRGGYIVGWNLGNVNPSRYNCRRFPAWIIERLTDRTPITNAPQINWLTDALNGLHNGNRDDTFTRVAGSLTGSGYLPGETFELLRARAKEVDFPENDLLRICRSIERYPLGTTSVALVGWLWTNF